MLGKFAQQAAGDFGGLVKAGLAHGVGQAGVGVAGDEGVARHARELLDVGAHQRRAKRAVQAHRQRLGVAHAVPEGADGLAAEDAAGGVGDRAADDQRQALAAGLKVFVDRKQRRLGVEGVEYRLDQQHIAAAFDQRLHLLQVGCAQIFKAGVARPWVVDVGADAGGLGRGAERADHIARMLGRAVLVAGRARQPRRLQVHLGGQMGHVVVGLGHRGGAKGVGLDQVGATGQIAFVDVGNQIGPGQAEQLVVAFDVLVEVLEALAPVLRLAELEALDHGAHGAVKNGNALAQKAGQGLGAGVGESSHGAIVGSRCAPPADPASAPCALVRQ